MRPSHSLDTQILFFQDVANQPIVKGEEEYTPLLRRIQSKSFFKEVYGDDQDISALTLWKTTQKFIDQLNCLLAEFHIPPVSKDELRQEVEPFVNDPDQDFPSCLSPVFQDSSVIKDKNTSIVELAWKCFFLVALFPVGSLSMDNLPEIEESMKQKLQEAEEARKQLLAGTIRFVTGIAQAHVDEGLPFLDLVQEGFLGLYKATEAYREYGGANFQQLSAIWVHQRIDRYIADSRSLIRIPVHRSEALHSVFQQAQEFMRQTGEIPNDQKLLSWILPVDDEESSDEDRSEDDVITPKDRALLNGYRILYYPFWSIEQIEISLESSSFNSLAIEDALVDEIDLEFLAARKQVCNNLRCMLKEYLTERQYQIVSLRYGLDGDAQTLDEIGKIMGVTRERIRQIELKAKVILERKKYDQALTEYIQGGEDRSFPRERINSTQRFQYESGELDLIRYGHTLDGYFEKQRLIRLADKYLKRPRGRRGRSQSTSLRISILESALRAIGRPAKYREIYQMAESLFNHPLPFSLGYAYLTLFYKNNFQALGNGYFTLASNQHGDCGFLNEDGIRVFPECPTPLIPANATSHAFLESILIVRGAVTRKPDMSAEYLFQTMQNWAKGKAVSPQQAFNAWYAAGVIEWIDYRHNTHQGVRLTISPSASLGEVRQHCLMTLAKRIIKVPELLKAIERMAAPSTMVLNRTLYEEEIEGYAVASRLALLLSLEAVQEENGGWRLTELGRGVLKLYPDIQLPDPQAMSEPEISSGEDELELELDLFDIA